MPTQLCNNKIIAQTLFLGASVSSFNNSVGWGGQPSQLTVNLVEDETPCFNQFQFASHSKNTLNHYHTCIGDDCFVNPDGSNYNSATDPIENRTIPGKVFYSINSNTNSAVVSDYWTKSDPGFFGRKTRIRPDGSEETNLNISYQYDLINTPVYFKANNFSFCGLVQSWNRDISSGGKNYTVTIQSMQSLLNSSYIIIDKYAGAIFSKKTGSLYGSPKNYLKTMGVTYTGSISEGNLPNIFNVYGFMESFGIEGFGPSYVNERGMSANKIVTALNVLTSSLSTGADNLDTIVGDQAPRRAFSPFGRILAKHAQLDAKSIINGSSLSVSNIYDSVTCNKFGIIPPSSSGYCEFLLDISELPTMSDDFRIQGPVISIMDFINAVAEQTGQDIYIDTIPIIYNGSVLYVIKVKTISRLSQPRPNMIENAIKEFECNNYEISSETIGKEKNESSARSLIIGGPQQRLYQAKSYRLAYTQSNLIYNDIENKFVDYMQLGYIDNITRTSQAPQQFDHGKIKRPNFLTTRNTLLSDEAYKEILDDEDEIQQEFTIGFLKNDIEWSDHLQTGGASSARFNGNYIGSYLIKQDNSVTAQWGLKEKQRWFPLHLDTICPFFGFVKEEEITLKVGNDNSTNDLRRIRPVWLDTWTGQIVVVLNVAELPEISVPLESTYDNSVDRCLDDLEFIKNNPPVQPQAAIESFKDDGRGQGRFRITKIRVTNPGKNIRSKVNVKITNSAGSSLGAKATAKVVNGALSSIDIADGGSGFKVTDGKIDATVELTLSEERPQNCLLSQQKNNTSTTQQFFILSESEIRAALAGFDNFLVYSLAKYYKPDLISMVRQAYIKKIANKLIKRGENITDAYNAAAIKTNWYWIQESTNIASEAGGVLSPSYLVADKPDGSQYIPDDAVHDLQIIHKFVTEIGKYYGKKYMVTATNLISYNDSDYNNVVIPTSAGNAYVFSGAGNIRYNYVPTNDGAWEEYGNFIDDTMVVGGPDWFSITDEKGKIKPLLGYNANKYFDYQRYMICQYQNQALASYRSDKQIDPYWDWNVYLNLIEQQNIECNTEDFIFPLIDTSTLNAGDYIISEVIEGDTSTPSVSNISKIISTSEFKPAKAYDAFGKDLNTSKNKLYINTTVEENFIYLDPDTKTYPKFLIDAPGLSLVNSSTKNAQDPSRTVIANTSTEDLSIYMRLTKQSDWNTDWIRHMLSYTRNFAKNYNNTEINTLSLYTNTSNQSALQVEMIPKAAHPFFVGIPVKSNHFSYGPWTNYPYLEYKSNPQNIFPDGKNIVQDSTLPPNCSSTSLVIGDNNARNAIDNWITPTNIDVREDFVPWNYGGMYFLDTIAYKEIETKINYESIIETAQIEIPGLPIFNLGGNFSFGNIGLGDYVINTNNSIFYDTKRSIYPGIITAYGTNDLSSYNINQGSINSNTIFKTFNFTIISIGVKDNITPGPIITNIQTGISQKGLSTTYSFRTYTRKLGLFNKEESDRIRRFNSESFRRSRQIAELKQEMTNIIAQQRKFLNDQRMNESTFGSKDFRSKLYGSSPSKVIIGRNSPYFPEPYRDPNRIPETSKYSQPDSINSVDGKVKSWYINRPGNSGTYTSRDYAQFKAAIGYGASRKYMGEASRYKVDAGLYQRKEVDTELNSQYGLKSAMSLDGFFSPISFYPTFENSTFSYSKHLTNRCPFCNGTKIISPTTFTYRDGQDPQINRSLPVLCDKCCWSNEKLDVALKGKSSNIGGNSSSEILPPYIITSGSDFQTLLNFKSSSLNTTSVGSISTSSSSNIPINLISLNPVIISCGEFKNTGAQNYGGSYEGVHENLLFATVSDTRRSFQDRGQHCIEIIARGAVPQSEYQYKLETSKNILKDFNNIYNIDYSDSDSPLKRFVTQLEPDYESYTRHMNHRFFGFRGPLVMHGWGFDTEGYPVPNAADEPYSESISNRPLRFALKITIDPNPIDIEKTIRGESYVLVRDYYAGAPIYGIPYNDNKYTNIKPVNGSEYNFPNQESRINENSNYFPPGTKVVYKIKIEDNLNKEGGYDPGKPYDLLDGYKGSIISKTQKWDPNTKQWSPKKKMKEFYLHWGERPDLWPVGPIDLRWDASRRVWTAGGGGGSTYKMVYATLEEDLVREEDFIETYPARAFLDDIEYNKDLPKNSRRLIYIKDRSGFTAPRGVKLLCRYDSDTGFYEPISKPTIITTGKIDTGNQATIDLTYIQGRQSGFIPTAVISFDNKLNFQTTPGKIGMFTYVGGKWILTSVQQN